MKINNNLPAETYRTYLAETGQEAGRTTYIAFENLPLMDKLYYHEIALAKILSARETQN